METIRINPDKAGQSHCAHLDLRLPSRSPFSEMPNGHMPWRAPLASSNACATHVDVTHCRRSGRHCEESSLPPELRTSQIIYWKCEEICRASQKRWPRKAALHLPIATPNSSRRQSAQRRGAPRVVHATTSKIPCAPDGTWIHGSRPGGGGFLPRVRGRHDLRVQTPRRAMTPRVGQPA